MPGPAFVVLAHKAPEQVARLAVRLAPLRVFVHVDARQGARARGAFAAALKVAPNAEILAPRRSGWASWGLVAAALDGVRSALRDPSCTHIMALSGQDYPLQAEGTIRAFFDEHRDTSSCRAGPCRADSWGPGAASIGSDRGRCRFLVAGCGFRFGHDSPRVWCHSLGPHGGP